jgi:hypothetical protein
MLLSALFLPGAGQIYNRQYGKGVFIIAGFGIPATLLFVHLLAWLADLYSRATGLAALEFLPRLRIEAVVAMLAIAVAFYGWSLADSFIVGSRLEVEEARSNEEKAGIARGPAAEPREG